MLIPFRHGDELVDAGGGQANIAKREANASLF